MSDDIDRDIMRAAMDIIQSAQNGMLTEEQKQSSMILDLPMSKLRRWLRGSRCRGRR